MRIIRLTDPFARGRPPEKLEWGSSAWAADSCLVEWSRLEREWLQPNPAQRPRSPAWAWSPGDAPLTFWLVILSLVSAFALTTCS